MIKQQEANEIFNDDMTELDSQRQREKIRMLKKDGDELVKDLKDGTDYLANKQKVSGLQKTQLEELEEEYQILCNDRDQLMAQINAMENKLRANPPETDAQRREKELLSLKEQQAIDDEEKAMKDKLDEIEKEISRLKKAIRQKDEDLKILYNKIKVKKNIVKQKQEVEDRYDPIPGDDIDARIAEYCNSQQTTVPCQRMEKGVYMFGTRKIRITREKNGAYTVFSTLLKKKFDFDVYINEFHEVELNHL